MNRITFIFISAIAFSYFSCNKDLIEYQSNDIQISIEKGEHYLHDFPLFLGIKQKNPPQMAIWVEDTCGNYLSTIYVTNKIGANDWQSCDEQRIEALPQWYHARGKFPTSKIADGISGATPRSSYSVKMIPKESLTRFVIKIEINHSRDYNDAYPRTAPKGANNYSNESGQPAIVYAVNIDVNSDQKEYEAVLIGHSSPDGSTNNLYSDTSDLTTALSIVKRIIIRIK